MATVEATINGQAREIDEGSTISSFLASRNIHEKSVVVEYNGDILSRGDFATREISQGDTLEIVQMMAGG